MKEEETFYEIFPTFHGTWIVIANGNITGDDPEFSTEAAAEKHK